MCSALWSKDQHAHGCSHISRTNDRHRCFLLVQLPQPLGFSPHVVRNTNSLKGSPPPPPPSSEEKEELMSESGGEAGLGGRSQRGGQHEIHSVSHFIIQGTLCHLDGSILNLNLCACARVCVRACMCARV